MFLRSLSFIRPLLGPVPVQGLSGTYKVLRRASVSLDTLYDVLDAPDHVADATGARELPAVRGEVVFENVRFGYQDGHPVPNGVDLHVRPGETVAIVGSSGGGKSTLMSPLQRFYDPRQGRVLVDGHDLRELRQQSLRRQIGVVQQEPVLFNDSVHSNIAYARPGASSAEVAGAASALDADAEASVQEAGQRLAHGRTAFIIAHRLSTTVMADRIVVLRDGRISECGRHDELMRGRLLLPPRAVSGAGYCSRARRSPRQRTLTEPGWGSC